jgi:hypothetical protein
LAPLRSRISASKPASERARLRALWRALLVLAPCACESAYPLAPTACDDYCRALQRADCADDAPADCVRDCELMRTSDTCDSALATLGDCYANSDASAFYCEDDHTKLRAVCLGERRTLDECRLPGSGACFEECVRQSEECDGSLDDCERACLEPSAHCREASQRYDACRLGFPVECRDWFQPETRPPEAVPCFDEALALLACDE